MLMGSLSCASRDSFYFVGLKYARSPRFHPLSRLSHCLLQQQEYPELTVRIDNRPQSAFNLLPNQHNICPSYYYRGPSTAALHPPSLASSSTHCTQVHVRPSDCAPEPAPSPLHFFSKTPIPSTPPACV
uniref:Uncharacterized protein n=1 Tax=Steinernema glaseri TaxID=37863 RepID=A0A1I7ZG46_9BILA